MEKVQENVMQAEKKEKKEVKVFIKNNMLASDLFVGVAMMALSIFLIAVSTKFPHPNRGIGPGVYPIVICSILLALGTAQTIRSLVQTKGFPIPDINIKETIINPISQEKAKLDEKYGNENKKLKIKKDFLYFVNSAKIVLNRPLVRVLLMVLVSYLFYKLLKIVGFLILAPIYLYSVLLLFGYKKKILGLVISLVLCTCVYFLFRRVFMVMLPQGLVRI